MTTTAQVTDAIDDIIALGDYIDLNSLTVARYHRGTENPDNGWMAESRDEGIDTDRENGAISIANNTDLGAHGKILRLIVVGINSYAEKNDNPTAMTQPHVVFQFQNIPGLHRMNHIANNSGGYIENEMREYLVPLDSDRKSVRETGYGTPIENTGAFYAGLIESGVPMNDDSIIWGPRRAMAVVNVNPNGVGNTVSIIEDVLWLPTEWEMFGRKSVSYPEETSDNQSSFTDWYDSDAKRKKYDGADSQCSYWAASPATGLISWYCYVSKDDFPGNGVAAQLLGLAPAFCVR
jgi:hypothetical protein